MENELWSDEATCGRCNRKLKDALSIERGYGPRCWEKVREEQDQEGES
ncbi:DUF6011 domain-containing protein [Gracilibacillus alcaliphilus]|nr:DUF6011 domain-containing protein [Gracilibacillus alcaliphilus]MBM7678947.1 hypothetical protein [Gracilibacillus alcaliphilus]